MSLKHFVSQFARYLRIGLASIAIFQFSIGGALADSDHDHDRHDGETRTPIKHVIVIIGENRSFDHVFATYVPKNGERVWNLLSQGIVKADGAPGPNFDKAHQLAATDSQPDQFLLNPPKSEFPSNQLPAPLAGGPSGTWGYFTKGNDCGITIPTTATPTQLQNIMTQCAEQSENGLPTGSAFYTDLASGGTGLTSKTPDTRITDVNTLPAGPFQLTNNSLLDYNAYAASPVHRFYQMWQQLNCGLDHATWEQPNGCNSKLFSWVEVTVGAGTNGAAQPSNFSTEYSPTAVTTGEGSTALGFYNVQNGDAPYFKSLADTYSMSDNFHQSVNGGTGANHIMLGHGDAIWFSDANGHPAEPPENAVVFTGTPDQGTVSEVENPNPATGTNNWYIEDGYGNSYNSGYPPPYTAEPASGGGSYSDCSDPKQPGVEPILKLLRELHVDSRCERGHYYLLNNYNPGWFGNGKNAYVDDNPANTPFTIPPSSTPNIGDDLNHHKISWAYFGDQWNNYVPDPYQINYGTNGPNADEYCNICNPFQYDTSIMSHPEQVAEHMKDTLDLYTDIANGTLPAVSFVKPSGYVDGHPASSKLNLFEGFTQKIVDEVKNSPYWKDTAIFITFDEGGGYYDSGYVQQLDFFGDGTRIPLIVVSPYATGGHISHGYSDHVSILKFIEANWGIEPVTHRSRDNFPNPEVRHDNPYVPLNAPALSDLMDLFHFDHHDYDHH